MASNARRRASAALVKCFDTDTLFNAFAKKAISHSIWQKPHLCQWTCTPAYMLSSCRDSINCFGCTVQYLEEECIEIHWNDRRSLHGRQILLVPGYHHMMVSSIEGKCCIDLWGSSRSKHLPHPSWTEIPAGLGASSNLSVQLLLLQLAKASCYALILHIRLDKSMSGSWFSWSKSSMYFSSISGVEIFQKK